MTIEEFLTKRLQQAIQVSEEVLEDYLPHNTLQSAIMSVKMAKSLLRIVEWHKQWPVFVEEPATYETIRDAADFNRFSMTMIRRQMWLTQEEYRLKFDSEPPTAPHLREMAQMFKNHPDFDPEWEI